MNIEISGINNISSLNKDTPDNASVSGRETGNTAQIAVSGSRTAQEAGISLLMRLETGAVFTGEIINITNNQITISLSDNAQVTATLSDALSYNIGDKASFSVKDNSGEQIILKSIGRENLQDQMNNQTVRSVIQNAGLAVNDVTVSLVRSLMKYGEPIDPSTLGNYIKMHENVPDASAEDIVLMTKMGIPVTQENAASLHDYYNFNEGIAGRTNDIFNNFYNVIADMAVNNSDGLGEFVENFTNILGEAVSTPESLGETFSAKNLEALSENIQALAEKYAGQTENGVTGKVSYDGVPETAKTLIDSLAAKVADGSITAKELMETLGELTKRQDIDKHALGKLVNSDEFAAVVKNMIRQEYFIRPEDVSRDNLRRMYAKIINDSSAMAEKFGDNPKMTAFVNSMNNAANDVMFLNSLNQFMSFVQIPLKMSGQNAHGDLYVYGRKKRSVQDKDEFKALLHLDMDNLGPMDIFVTMRKKNISTDFKVATDEILEYIEEHMDELTVRLNRLGYKVSNTVEISGKDYSFKSSVIENQFPPMEIKRFSFDVRA